MWLLANFTQTEYFLPLLLIVILLALGRLTFILIKQSSNMKGKSKKAGSGHIPNDNHNKLQNQIRNRETKVGPNIISDSTKKGLLSGSKSIADIPVGSLCILLHKVLKDYKITSIHVSDSEKLENIVKRISDLYINDDAYIAHLSLTTSNESSWLIIETRIFFEWLMDGLILLEEIREQLEFSNSKELPRNRAVEVSKQNNASFEAELNGISDVDFLKGEIQVFRTTYLYLRDLKTENLSLFNESYIDMELIFD